MQKLLLLHGALGSEEQFKDLKATLATNFDVYSINFSGHGGKPIPEEAFSIEFFANDVLKWLEENSISQIDVFGYSMGGYVALYIARKWPDKTSKIFTLATKFDWSEETAAKEIKMLDPAKIKEKVPDYAEQLRRRHGEENWEQVLKKTAEMMINLGRNKTLEDEDLRQINNEVQVSVGDNDKMVTLEETVNAFRDLKNGRLLVMANTPHPIEIVDAQILCREIKSFF